MRVAALETVPPEALALLVDVDARMPRALGLALERNLQRVALVLEMSRGRLLGPLPAIQDAALAGTVALLFDGVQPTRRIVDLVSGGETVAIFQTAVCAGTNASIIAAPPVGQVVTALGAGLGVVRNLICW